MGLLSTADWPAVRALLDVALDSTALPDSVIALPVYRDRAEQWGVDRDPDIATRTGTERERARRGLLYYLAALLAPSLPQIVSEQFPEDYRYQRSPRDIAQQVAWLRQAAGDEMDAYLHSAAAPRMVGVFGRARGRRVIGRCGGVVYHVGERFWP